MIKKILFGFLVLFLVACSQTTVVETSEELSKFDDPNEIPIPYVDIRNSIDIWKNLPYDYTGTLDDVSESGATGYASSYFDGERYVMFAEFENLPKAPPGFFYEGWVVRKGLKFNVYSTGEVIINPGVEGTGTYNIYSSSEDLTDHDFYVLTLEPRDNDPAPAEHIIEGTMIKN